MLHAVVDPDLCTSCGICPTVCPEVFEFDANNIAYAKLDPVPPQFEEASRSAAEQCPVDAIRVYETADTP